MHAVAYVQGTIRPSHKTRADLDEATRAFYEAWKARYLVEGCGTGRRYVRYDGPAAGTIATSEGQGYGMLIAALMAGHDPDARATFDGLFRFARDHPSLSDPALMAWAQRSDCTTGPDGEGPATDGDVDIAFALLLADRQWGSAGPIDYLAEARKTAVASLATEIHATRYDVLLGDPAIHPAANDGARTSDFIPDHFKAFSRATGDLAWDRVVDRVYQLVALLQADQSPSTGLLPDFVVGLGSAPRPAPANFLEGPYDGAYYYNACRDPWRLGTDYLVTGDARALGALRKLNAWARAKSGGDPAKIVNGYGLDGRELPVAGANDMAFLAPFAVAAMVEARDQDWLNAAWDRMAARSVDPDDGYFGNTLKLISMIVISGNWWAP